MTAYKHILDIHPNACVVHVNFRPLYANDAFARFSGLESAEQILSLDSLMVLIDSEEHADAQIRYQQAMDEKQATPAKIIPHTDLFGNPAIVEITDRAIIWDGQPALCTFITVVTDKIKKQRRLKKLSEQDALTNIPNRRYLINTMNEHQQNGVAEQYYMALIDIDFFRRVNDQYSHLAGDAVLIQFSELLAGFCDESDHLARLGGEEFVLLIKSNNLTSVEQRIENLRSTVETNHFIIASNGNHEAPRLRCTVSIGVTDIVQGEQTDLPYGRADKALYLVKNSGRNQVRVQLAHDQT
ncbi:sensor domain-containing diguanylate cyclase [Vibrio sp. S11_S32]|uniref:GGDEF domain-containing protein n=1 Tax=Vibrio sp. S11_S32 TaxID=2720225 RepID=UPI00167FF79A|nr:sensor domain-containing diguanylate cyclase [Vibrio sp. S11_S32]MBD1576246.1 sensor domain-containing diguanylate cyclase [Vibrio sp. S11_S32]